MNQRVLNTVLAVTGGWFLADSLGIILDTHFNFGVWIKFLIGLGFVYFGIVRK